MSGEEWIYFAIGIFVVTFTARLLFGDELNG